VPRVPINKVFDSGWVQMTLPFRNVHGQVQLGIGNPSLKYFLIEVIAVWPLVVPYELMCDVDREDLCKKVFIQILIYLQTSSKV